MAEKTLSDFVAKQNKNLPFEERSKKFQERVKPICEELGVMPWAKLIQDDNSIVAVPSVLDLWQQKS